MSERGRPKPWPWHLLGLFRSLYQKGRHTLRDHKIVVLSLGIIGIAAFLTRFLAIARHGAPSGADYGNYLTNLHAFLGNDVTGQGVQYPAVFLLYLWGIVSLFGELPGLQVSGPLLGAALCLPSYLLLRNFVERPLALVGTALITFAEGISEMIGWGGNPNLLGMIFGALFMAFLQRFVQHGKRADLLRGAVSFGLLAGSHQIALVFFGVTAIFGIVLLAVKLRNKQSIVRSAEVVAAGLLFSIPFLPFYVVFTLSSSELLPQRPIPFTLADLTFVVTWLFRESLALWILLSIVAILGYRSLGSSNKVGFSFGIALFASPFILATTIMVLHPVRPLYFLYLGIVPGAMVFVQDAFRVVELPRHLPRPSVDRTTVVAALVLAFALVVVSTAGRRATQAADWYLVVGDDVREGLEWIKQNTPKSSVIATSGPSRYGPEQLVGCTWGWWIEGYAQRKSFCTADPQALAWSSQVQRTLEANKAFAGPISLENGWLRVGDYWPYGSRGNPIISGDFGHGYEALLYFNDARVTVTWSPDGGGPVRIDSLYLLTSRSTSHVVIPSHVRLEFGAQGNGITINRTVELASGSGTVWVNYSFEVSGEIDRVDISVFGTSTSSLNDFDFAAKKLQVGGVPGFREKVAGSVQVGEGGDVLNETAMAFETNPDVLMPEVRFAFSPNGGSYRVSFMVEAYYDRSYAPTDVRVFDAYSIFADVGVGFVLVDKHKIRDVEWFTNDLARFRMVHQNFGIAVFEVR